MLPVSKSHLLQEKKKHVDRYYSPFVGPRSIHSFDCGKAKCDVYFCFINGLHCALHIVVEWKEESFEILLDLFPNKCFVMQICAVASPDGEDNNG